MKYRNYNLSGIKKTTNYTKGKKLLKNLTTVLGKIKPCLSTTLIIITVYSKSLLLSGLLKTTLTLSKQEIKNKNTKFREVENDLNKYNH